MRQKIVSKKFGNFRSPRGHPRRTAPADLRGITKQPYDELHCVLEKMANLKQKGGGGYTEEDGCPDDRYFWFQEPIGQRGRSLLRGNTGLKV